MKRIGRLEIVSFITGFSLMAFELAAARILAPTIGSSTYVWTSVIGVIIAALSLGYYAGGVIADKRGHSYDVSWLLVVASALVAFTLVIYADVLQTVANWHSIDIRVQAVAAALVLFAPASFILGAISPYLAKLNVRSLRSSGRAVASLSALNSIGGIVGTFVTGFVLFGHIGSKETVALVVLLLAVASWVLERTHKWRLRAGLTALLGLLSLLVFFAGTTTKVVAIDTAAAHYEVQDFLHNGTLARGLTTGPEGVQSAVRLDGSKELLFWYTKMLAEATLAEQPASVLVLGGGAFTLPEYLATHLPQATIDVVEIDPKLEGIAKEYFHFEPKPNLNLIFEDARTYINQTDKTYDVIIADVYGDGSIPFSLVTKEYGAAVAQRTTPGGIVLANIIGGLSGPCRDVLEAVSNAYAQALPYARYAVNPTSDIHRANIIARYSRTDDDRTALTPMGTHPPQAYNDNFAPLERLYYDCRARSR